MRDQSQTHTATNRISHIFYVDEYIIDSFMLLPMSRKYTLKCNTKTQIYYVFLFPLIQAHNDIDDSPMFTRPILQNNNKFAINK